MRQGKAQQDVQDPGPLSRVWGPGAFIASPRSLAAAAMKVQVRPLRLEGLVGVEVGGTKRPGIMTVLDFSFNLSEPQPSQL